MFDWPAASHTSPMNTSLNVVASVSLATVSSKGPPAFMAGNVIRHRPRSSARVSKRSLPKANSTFSPRGAMPQIATG